MKKLFYFFIYILICSFNCQFEVIGTDKTLDSEIKSINKLLSLSEECSDENKALQYAKKALLLSKKIDNQVLTAQSYSKIGTLHDLLGNKTLAIESHLSSLKIFKKLNHKIGISESFLNLGVIYFSNQESELAIIYFKRALKILPSNEIYLQASCLTNIGEAYRLSQKKDSAKSYLNKALNKNRLLSEDQKQLGAYSLGNLGIIYFSENKLDSAKIYLNKSLKILSPFEDSYSISYYKAELGKIYLKENKFSIANEKFLEAIEIAKRAGLKEQIRDFNKLLSNFYSTQKDYKKALYHQQQFQIYQDSLVNKENVKKIEQLKAGYEIDKRETQIGLLHKVNSTQKKWLISLGVGILSFILLASLLFISRRKVRKANIVLAQQKEEISKREQEKAWLLRELNHRVKNNLQMVASLLNLQSNKLTGHPAQEAILIGKQRVEALSLVHRKLYQEGVDTRINIKDYITELILGLFHAYNANFKPQITISDDVSVNIDSAIPLALIVNEIIINCLKYAYEGIDCPSLEVEISVLPEQRLAIHIWDNGVGFDENAEMKDSLGMKIIKSLTRQLDGSVTHFNEDGAHWRLNVLGK